MRYPDAVPVLVEPSDRLHEQRRLGQPFRNRGLGDISLISCIAMHMRTRLVGIARELQHDARDQVLLVPVSISVSFMSRLMNIDVA